VSEGPGMTATPRERSAEAPEAGASTDPRPFDSSQPMPPGRTGATADGTGDGRGVGQGVGLSQRAATVAGRAALIAQAFKAAVVPELARRHPPMADAPGQARRAAIVSRTELASLAAHVLANDREACLLLIDGLADRGLTLAQICLDVLAPTALRLGQMWDEDRCSFVDVTIGLGILHAMLQRAAERFAPQCLPARDPARRVLLASLSGEQHSFGLAVLGELFRQSGWDVTTAAAMTEADLADTCRRDWFAIAGLSVAADERARMLPGVIRMMRAGSVNPAIGIMVGGPALIQHPELAERSGADIAACDANDAVLRAEGLRVLLAVGAARR
jgi:methanogenic corrinoid protein MtbC1